MHQAYKNLIITVAGGFALIFFNSAVQDYTPGGLLLFTETLFLVVYWFPPFSLKKELKDAWKRLLACKRRKTVDDKQSRQHLNTTVP